jgi:hypothetical protein
MRLPYFSLIFIKLHTAEEVTFLGGRGMAIKSQSERE